MIEHNIRTPKAFFGRRQGKRLRNSQLARINTLLPTFKIDLNTPSPLDLTSLFPNKVTEVRLEIGFGGGEHLLHEMDHFSTNWFYWYRAFYQWYGKNVTVS